MLNGASRLLSTIFSYLTFIHLQRLEWVFGLPRPSYKDACYTGDDVPLPRYGIVETQSAMYYVCLSIFQSVTNIVQN